jgi:hypothetical protein
MRKKKSPALNAVKHGIYSNVGLLPGEDVNEFERLLEQLTKELRPAGALECAVVADLAKLQWRKGRLGIYARAEIARRRWEKWISHKDAPFSDNLDWVLLLREAEVSSALVENLPKLQEAAQADEEAKAAVKTTEELLGMAINLFGKDKVIEAEKELEAQAADVHLAYMGDKVSVEELEKELELHARIDAQIDRLLKRLMQLKAMKPLVGLGVEPVKAAPPRAVENNSTGTDGRSR